MTRYFWGLLNLNNEHTDPTRMSWEPVRQTKEIFGNEVSVTYDIFGSDEGVKEREIVVFGPEIRFTNDFEWGE